MTEYVLRFIAGGLFVSLFAIIGDVVRPKSFAGDLWWFAAMASKSARKLEEHKFKWKTDLICPGPILLDRLPSEI